MNSFPKEKLTKLVNEKNWAELEKEIAKWLDSVAEPSELAPENPMEQFLAALKTNNEEMREELAAYKTLLKFTKSLGRAKQVSKDDDQVAGLKKKISDI